MQRCASLRVAARCVHCMLHCHNAAAACPPLHPLPPGNHHLDNNDQSIDVRRSCSRSYRTRCSTRRASRRASSRGAPRQRERAACGMQQRQRQRQRVGCSGRGSEHGRGSRQKAWQELALPRRSMFMAEAAAAPTPPLRVTHQPTSPLHTRTPPPPPPPQRPQRRQARGRDGQGPARRERWRRQRRRRLGAVQRPERPVLARRRRPLVLGGVRARHVCRRPPRRPHRPAAVPDGRHGAQRHAHDALWPGEREREHEHEQQPGSMQRSRRRRGLLPVL